MQEDPVALLAAAGVVVRDILVENDRQVAFASDIDAIGTFAVDGVDLLGLIPLPCQG